MASLDDVLVQISRLAPRSQVTELRAALDEYKADTDARIDSLTAENANLKQRVTDLANRVAALEA